MWNARLRIVSGLLVVSCLALGGCPPAPPVDGGTTPATTAELFERVWTDFSRNYAHFGAKQVDWDAIKAKYQAEFASELSTAEFVQKLAPMLAELKDLNVTLLDGDGSVVPVYTKAPVRNYPTAYLEALYFPDGLTQLKNYPLRHGWMGKNIAYVSIEGSTGWEGLQASDLDSLVQTYAGAAGLILDIRRAEGSDEAVAKQIASHFTAEARLYGYTRERVVGDDRNAFAAPVAKVLQPASGDVFLKPVILLIGEKNTADTEWFVLMMLACPTVESGGDHTRGSCAGVKEFSLSNGVKYWIPTAIATRADGTAIEDTPTQPTVEDLTLPPDVPFDDTQDRLLDRAWLRLTGPT